MTIPTYQDVMPPLLQVLPDGDELAELMIDYNLGVSVQNTYEIKRIDSDYFVE